MFLTMFFKTQNIEQTMHLTMLIAHPYQHQHQIKRWVGGSGRDLTDLMDLEALLLQVIMIMMYNGERL